MRILAIMLAAALGIGLAAPAAAENGVSVRIGGGDALENDTPANDAKAARPSGSDMAPLDPLRRPGVQHRPRDGRRDGKDRDRRRGKRPDPPEGPAIIIRKPGREDRDERPDRKRRRPFFLFPRVDDDDDDDRIILVPVPQPQPAAPEPAAPEPAPPPDPRGPAIQRARGAAAEDPVVVGEPLPQNVPHVTLDWRSYGLPEPPPGLVYARVGRAVLLIDPATRVVERRVDPSELARPEAERAG